MNGNWQRLVLFAVLSFLSLSCQKQTDYLYEVDTVNVEQDGGSKNQVKSTTEFASIAHNDLFGSPISQSDLVKLNTVYTAFGDKKIIEDLIIRNFLNRPGIQVPASPAVNGDTSVFIVNTWKKFYNREPDAFEIYFITERLRSDTSLNPLAIYYSLMTSDEYRYY